MPSTVPTPPSGSAQPRQLPPPAVDAVQRALAAEYAAEWAYGLASAFLAATAEPAITEGRTAHRTRRYATERLLHDVGAVPRPAEPAYLPPEKVTDQASTVALLVAAESDAAAAWRSVLERTDDADLRRIALDALTSSAVRATRWRRTGQITPAAPPFPGRS